MKYDDIESPNIGERSNKTPSVKSSWGFHFRQVLKGGAALAALGLAALGGKLFYEFLGGRKSSWSISKVEEVDETGVAVRDDESLVAARHDEQLVASNMLFADQESKDVSLNSSIIPQEKISLFGSANTPTFAGELLSSAETSYWVQAFRSGSSSDNSANSIQQTTDGGYIVAGYTRDNFAGKQEALILKLDSFGVKLWVKSFYLTNTDTAFSIQQTTDGGYIVAGGTGGPGMNALMLKLNSSGAKLWAKQFGGSWLECANSIQQTADGGYVVVGTTSGTSGTYDALILKLDSSGNKLWAKMFEGSSADEAYSIQQTSDGGYIVAGSTSSTGAGGSDVLILKLNSYGGKTWVKTFGGSAADYAYSVKQTSDGGYIIAGSTSSTGAGSYDVLILKLNSSGNKVWAKTFGGSAADYAYSVKQTSDGGYIIAGSTSSTGAGSEDVLILKLNSSGSKTWAKTFGGSRYDRAYSIQQTADGGYVVAGYTGSIGAGYYDALILRLDTNGNVKDSCWSQRDVSWETVNAGLTEGTVTWTMQDSTSTLTSSGSLVLTDKSLTSTTVCREVAPVLNIALQSQTNCCSAYVGQNYNFVFASDTFVDSDGDILTYTAKKAENEPLPVWLSFNSAARTFSGTPIIPETLSITLTASDGTLSVTDTFILTVSIRAPILAGTLTPYQIILVNQTYIYTFPIDTFTDPNGYVLTYSATLANGLALPNWLGFNSTARMFSGVPAMTDTGKTVVKVIADNSYLATSGTFLLTVQTPPEENYWIKTFGGGGIDSAASIRQTADSGYIVVGQTNNAGAGGDDFLILRLNNFGNKVWVKTFGGEAIEYAHFVRTTTDGGCIMAGWTTSVGVGSLDFLILKLDSFGNKLWAKTFGGAGDDRTSRIQQTADGGYVVAGGTYSIGTGGDALILRLDSTGNRLWAKTFGGVGNENLDVREVNDGGYIGVGMTNSAGAGSEDCLIVKLDSFGNRIWAKTLGGVGAEHAQCIQQTADGGYVVAGSTNSVGAGSNDALIFKLDSLGNQVWAKTFGGSDSDILTYVQQTADGGYFVAGNTQSIGAGDTDFFALKLDYFGNKVWAKTFGGGQTESLWSAQQTTDGGYILSGYTESVGSGNLDALIIKLDVNGNVKDGCWGQNISWQTINATLIESIVYWETQDASSLTLASADSLVLTDWDPTETVVCTERSPVLNVALQSQTGCCFTNAGKFYSFVFADDTFIDPDDDFLTYTATQGNNSTLPLWLSFNATERAFSGIPAIGDGGIVPIQLIASDGDLSVTDSFSLRINDAPIVQISSELISYTEDNVAVVITPTLSITDVDSTNLSNATVAITDGFNAAEDVLSFTAQSGIVGNYSSSNSTLIFTGIAPIIDYQALLRTVTYKDTSQNPSTANRTISFQVTDEEGATSEVVNKIIQVIAVNDQPVVNFPLRNQTGCCGVRIGEAYNFTFAANTFFDADRVQTSSVLRFADSPNKRKLTGFSRIKGSQNTAESDMPMMAGLGVAGAVGIGLFSCCFFRSKKKQTIKKRLTDFCVTKVVMSEQDLTQKAIFK